VGNGAQLAEERVTYRAVFAVSEFRYLWMAQLLSVAGDQLARVALTVLVYDRTRSSVLAAVTFVASVVPTIIGGTLFSGVADRLPRRQVMIGCDVIRLLLVLAMVIPGMPLAVLILLLCAVTAVSAPFTAARAATYPVILTGDRYTAATALSLTTFQFAQVAGFSLGGVLVAALGARVSLVADAATFGLSALLIGIGVAARPSAHQDGSRRPRPLADIGAGFRLVFGNPALRVPMLFGWLAAAYNAPEGIAAPLARVLGGGAITVGLLLAAPAAGYTAGALIFGRVSPTRRQQLMPLLAIACCALLVPMAAKPGLVVALVLFAVSGGCACFQVSANARFVLAAPPHQRGQAFGLAGSGMALGQGVAMILAGLAVQYTSAWYVVAAAGAVGAIAAVALTVSRSART
jgi:MFS family permease